MPEVAPRGLQLCANCTLRKGAKVVIEGFNGTANFDNDGTLNYHGGGNCGLMSGQMSPEAFAASYPTTAEDFQACERPLVVERDITSGWRKIFGLTEVVEVEQCPALYETELAKIIEDVIERTIGAK